MMIIDTLLKILLLSLWCWGWWELFQPGQALYFISRKAHKRLAIEKKWRDRANKFCDKRKGQDIFEAEKKSCEGLSEEDINNISDKWDDSIEHNHEEFERVMYWRKPLFLCGVCFASIYGTGGYLLLHYCGEHGIAIVSIIALVAVNKILMKLFI